MGQNQSKIRFFREKKWIMAWWFKRTKNYQFSENQMLNQWHVWWKADFVDTEMEDERLHNAFKWVREKVSSMTMEEIKKCRYDVAETRSIPKGLQQMANDKGYFIKKGAVGKHPLTVSGYQICELGKGKKVLHGKKFDLTIKQVKEFLDSEGKVN